MKGAAVSRQLAGIVLIRCSPSLGEWIALSRRTEALNSLLAETSRARAKQCVCLCVAILVLWGNEAVYVDWMWQLPFHNGR